MPLKSNCNHIVFIMEGKQKKNTFRFENTSLRFTIVEHIVLRIIIEREVVKINDFLDQDNSRSFTKNAKCWEDLKDMLEGHTIPASLLISEDDNLEEYNEEEKGIIIQANAIPVELWEAMLIWAKKENKLSLIERRQISNYIKKFENNRLFKTIKTAEKAIALKKKAELLGFSI